jgi:hypothetical protein
MELILFDFFGSIQIGLYPRKVLRALHSGRNPSMPLRTAGDLSGGEAIQAMARTASSLRSSK